MLFSRGLIVIVVYLDFLFTSICSCCWYTVHSLLLLLYSVQSLLLQYSPQSDPATVQCTVSSCFCTVKSHLFQLYSVQCTVCSYCRTVHSRLLLLYIAQPNPATVQCTVYYNCCCTLRAIRRDFTGTVFFWYLIAYILYLMSLIYRVFTFYA